MPRRQKVGLLQREMMRRPQVPKSLEDWLGLLVALDLLRLIRQLA